MAKVKTMMHPLQDAIPFKPLALAQEIPSASLGF